MPPELLQDFATTLSQLRCAGHHQHAQGMAPRLQAFDVFRLRQLKRQVHPEIAALTRCTGYPGAAAHELAQAFDDGQPQPGTTIPARGAGVCLHKGLEQTGHLLGRQPDAGIRHMPLQAIRALRAGHQPRLKLDFPGVRELDGVAHQVHQHLPQAVAIPLDVARHLGRLVGHQRHALGLCLGGVERPDFIQQGLHIHHADHQVGLPRLDLGQIQHVVHDGHQRTPGGLGLGHQLALLRRQLAGQHQVRDAQQRIEGRADLMAHVGQELALAFVGALGLFLGLLQLLFIAVPLGDVLHRTDDTRGRSVLIVAIAKDLGDHTDPQGAPLGGDHLELQLEAALALGDEQLDRFLVAPMVFHRQKVPGDIVVHHEPLGHLGQLGHLLGPDKPVLLEQDGPARHPGGTSGASQEAGGVLQLDLGLLLRTDVHR